MAVMLFYRIRNSAVLIELSIPEVRPPPVQLTIARLDALAGHPESDGTYRAVQGGGRVLSQELHRLHAHHIAPRWSLRWDNFRHWSLIDLWDSHITWMHHRLNPAGDGCSCWASR